MTMKWIEFPCSGWMKFIEPEVMVHDWLGNGGGEYINGENFRESQLNAVTCKAQDHRDEVIDANCTMTSQFQLVQCHNNPPPQNELMRCEKKSPKQRRKMADGREA